MAENGSLPDHLRCKRTDGRRWRCSRRVMQGKKLCEIHHLQGKHRQNRWKVPESLKIQREYSNVKGRFRAQNGEVKLGKNKKRKKLDLGLLDEVKKKKMKRIKAKKNALQFELIRMVLKREGEKRNKKKKTTDSDSDKSEEDEEELMQDLPNGFMAISPAKHFNNVGSCSASTTSCEVKIGADFSSRRRFRSKNIEPIPIAALQVLPGKRDVVELNGGKKMKKKKCHCCRKSGLSTLIRCSSCRKEFFCMDCIKDQYFDEQEEVQTACPVCRGTCGCKACSAIRFRDRECEEFSNEGRQVNKVLYFHYMICMLLPVLKQMNKDLTAEMKMEAKRKGLKLSEIQIQQAKVSSNQRSCNNCKVSIADFHRSCQSCSYNLCFSCCRDIFQRSIHRNGNGLVSKCPTRRKALISSIQLPEMITVCTSKKRFIGKCLRSSTAVSSWKDFDGCDGISCPPSEFGGCGDSLLELSCIFPLSQAKELETSAEELIGCYELPETLDADSSCSLCTGSDLETDEIKKSQEASAREDSHDNLLYCPSVQDINGDNLEHFQKHWGKGQPVKVRNVLLGTSDLSWDPIVMFCTYLKNNAGAPGDAKDCLDYFEVEIGVRQLFTGSIRGPKNANVWHEGLKLKGWLSSHAIQGHLSAHYAEILHALPLPEYMDPTSGVLNVAAELPQEMVKPDLGPCIYISYNSGESNSRADSESKLRYDTYDMVNILVHATDALVSTEQLNYIRKLMKKNSEHNRANGEALPDGGNIDKLRLHDLVKEDTQLHSKVARVSWFTASAHRSHDQDAEDFHDGVRPNSDSDSDTHTDTDSDTDTDTDSEISEFFFRPFKGSRTSEHQHMETSDNDSLAEKHEESCGAIWDVFRRQDVPKLVEYLTQQCNKFTDTNGSRNEATHPLHDQTFFLDAVHKRRLKEEFEIEPWTFEQHIGEAVIVPAGCPYQIRNVKSCVNVVLDFVSSESVTQSIQLIDELRLLPDRHKAKVDCFEVKKMALHGVGRAIKEIRELTSSTE
ncbi:Lysine-specific demethylase JMJ28 [Linum perenne]